MSQRVYHGQAVRLAARALAHGAEHVSPTLVRWNIAGNCNNPYTREVWGRPEAYDGPRIEPDIIGVDGDGVAQALPVTKWVRDHSRVLGRDRGYVMVVELLTRCRDCEPCLRARANLWRLRARAETAMSARTWFGTITLGPDAHHRFLEQARLKEAGQWTDFDALGTREQWRLRCEAISGELTKYLKRVRKNSGAPLRYLLVAEAHKSGLPHWHILVHECDYTKPVRYAELRKQWPYGFTKFNLVTDPRQATYLCKYISKDALVRVRASIRYGEGSPEQKTALAISSKIGTVKRDHKKYTLPPERISEA
jgi:hypothetical protein